MSFQIASACQSVSRRKVPEGSSRKLRHQTSGRSVTRSKSCWSIARKSAIALRKRRHSKLTVEAIKTLVAGLDDGIKLSENE